MEGRNTKENKLQKKNKDQCMFSFFIIVHKTPFSSVEFNKYLLRTYVQSRGSYLGGFKVGRCHIGWRKESCKTRTQSQGIYTSWYLRQKARIKYKSLEHMQRKVKLSAESGYHLM